MTKYLIAFSVAFFFCVSAQAQLKIGDEAPDIKLPDSLGKWKPLSEVKAKIVMVDFWAAWCYPCVRSLPELKSLYTKYHEQGLEIYAVSLDKDYYNWVNACRKHELPFVLVNEAYSFNGKSCKDYKVDSIPSKFLVKDGKIIGAEMSLYDLEKVIQHELEKP